MSIFGFGDATALNPKGQFSGRCANGMGVAHRARHNTGQPALFANTPLEVMNRREFVCYWQEFIDNMDCSHTVGAAGVPGGLWELTAVGGTATFDLLEDAPNGLGELRVVEVNDNFGAQIQLFPSSISSTGECMDPINQQLVTWAMSGKMTFPLTSSWYIGLAEDDTTFLDNAGAITATTKYIGFYHLADATTVDLVQRGDTDNLTVTPLQALWTPADSENPLLLRELGLRIEGNDKMYWYFNGICIGATKVGTVETGGTVEAFTGKMTPTVCLVNNGGSNAAVVWIDYHTFQTTRIVAPVGG